MVISAHLLSAESRDSATVGHLRDWYASSSPMPISVGTPLDADFAARLVQAMERLLLWRHITSVIDVDQRVRDVGLDEWHASPDNIRWSSQRIVNIIPLLRQQVELDPASRAVFDAFFSYFIVGVEFRKWLSMITRQLISRKFTCEFARYEAGDFITRHADRHDDRIIGVNIYLGPWMPGWGGQLGYLNDRNETHFVDPIPNSMSLFRIADGCLHWVDPWTGPVAGRYTISMSFCAQRHD